MCNSADVAIIRPLAACWQRLKQWQDEGV